MRRGGRYRATAEGYTDAGLFLKIARGVVPRCCLANYSNREYSTKHGLFSGPRIEDKWDMPTELDFVGFNSPYIEPSLEGGATLVPTVLAKITMTFQSPSPPPHTHTPSRSNELSSLPHRNMIKTRLKLSQECRLTYRYSDIYRNLGVRHNMLIITFLCSLTPGAFYVEMGQ